ncbi:hypothetical protein AXG93_3337s1120 [Marchantia polymorpha subsp. ruderalis]|uniref:Uncharacterized protein n=1 Tax=Marchantia polymorpha subsp. ruderalis TaxID=1480154 RepID=A0A176W3P4_MARPO|nr:hypothetical protein AXG93_3337s1120 [Marchantia polymorpha subsp. ruderalis]
MEGSSDVLIKVPAEAPAEPLKEGMEIFSPNSLSSERTHTAGSEETPHPKISEELVKELTLSDEVLEQVVAQVGGTVVDAPDSVLPSSSAGKLRPPEETKTSEEEPKKLVVSFPEFLHDSVIPILKYLDGKRVKYVVSKEVGFYVEMMRNRTQLKRALAVKREWDSTTALAKEQVASLTTECAAAKSNENGQKITADLLTRLEKSREAYDEAVKRSERLITTAEKREKKHIEELATLEARRAEEVCITEELRGKIAEAKTTQKDLCSKMSEIEGCGEQLGKADMRSQESQRRMEKAEEAYRQLRDEITDGLKLHLEKCLNGFAMWELQTVKWLKLFLLERRLMSPKTSGSAGHKQIVELVNTFSEELNEACQNVEVEIINVLRRLGVDVSLEDTVTVTSDGTTPETDSPQAVDIPELPS